MSAYKPNIHKLNGKLDYNDKPIIVTFKIEHIMLISNIINTIKRCFDISKTFPLTPLNFYNPILNCNTCGRKSFRIFFQSLFSKDSHTLILSTTKLANMFYISKCNSKIRNHLCHF